MHSHRRALGKRVCLKQVFLKSNHSDACGCASFVWDSPGHADPSTNQRGRRNGNDLGRTWLKPPLRQSRCCFGSMILRALLASCLCSLRMPNCFSMGAESRVSPLQPIMVRATLQETFEFAITRVAHSAARGTDLNAASTRPFFEPQFDFNFFFAFF